MGRKDLSFLRFGRTEAAKKIHIVKSDQNQTRITTLCGKVATEVFFFNTTDETLNMICKYCIRCYDRQINRLKSIG